MEFQIITTLSLNPRFSWQLYVAGGKLLKNIRFLTDLTTLPLHWQNSLVLSLSVGGKAPDTFSGPTPGVAPKIWRYEQMLRKSI